jgi:hypothetical protein
MHLCSDFADALAAPRSLMRLRSELLMRSRSDTLMHLCSDFADALAAPRSLMHLRRSGAR